MKEITISLAVILLLCVAVIILIFNNSEKDVARLVCTIDGKVSFDSGMMSPSFQKAGVGGEWVTPYSQIVYIQKAGEICRKVRP